MNPQITLTRLESVPDCERVYHFDELSDREQTTLSNLVRDGVAASVDPETAARLSQYDIVKFTDYYRVEYDDSPASSPVSA